MIIYFYRSFGGGAEESRRLLEQAISEYLGDREEARRLAGRMCREKLGKPYIDGFSEFSISHSGNVWAVLFSDKICGLDIQFPRKCDIIAVSRRAYAAEDRRAVESALAEDAGRASDVFFRIWTRREALAKAPGASAFDSGLPSVSSDRTVMDGVSYRLYDIQFPGMDDMKAAVCIREDAGSGEAEIDFRELGAGEERQGSRNDG